jgi:PAS domain S-box-containing protein
MRKNRSEDKKQEVRNKLRASIIPESISDNIVESEEIFRNLFENSSSAIAIINRDTTIIMVNDAYCNISGYTRKEIIGSSWTKHISHTDLERILDYNSKRFNNCNDVPDKYEFSFYHKNGNLKYGLISVA